MNPYNCPTCNLDNSFPVYEKNFCINCCVFFDNQIILKRNIYECPECYRDDFVGIDGFNNYCPHCCIYFYINYKDTLKKYKQINNVKKILLHYMGKSAIKISEETKLLLHELIKDKPYSNKLYNECKKILLAKNMKKNIQEINTLYCIINKGQIIKLNYQQEENIIRIFRRIFIAFNNIKNKYGRKNVIKIDYLLYKVFCILNIDTNIHEHLKPLKRKSTIKLYNQIWEEIKGNLLN